jgi:hypothetical protein
MFRELDISHLQTQIQQDQEERNPASTSNNEQDNLPLEANLKLEYLAAVEEHIATRRRYNEIFTRTPHKPQTPEPEPSTSNSLYQHLELLREQGRHASFIDLRDRLHEVQFACVLPAAQFNSTTLVTQPEISESKHGLAAAAKSAAQTIQHLQAAVVQAHFEAEREKALLEQARSSISINNGATPQSQLFAISAARRELTTWLEQGLAQCREDDSLPPSDPDYTLPDWEAKIDTQYNQYLEARRRVLNIAAEMRAVLVASETQSTNEGEEPETQPLASSRRLGSAEAANAIETRVLPSTELQSVSHAHLLSTVAKSEKEIETTINILSRLGDESQLLPAFPVLSQSGRFTQATRIFGQEPNANRNEADDPVSRSLEPWLFAGGAADVASRTTTQKLLEQGQKAMDTVASSLAELKLLKNPLT